MSGMNCDRCGQLLQYNEQIVALRDDGDELVAAYTIEGEGGAVRETFEPKAKYHVDCYRELRNAEPEDWPELVGRT